MTLQHLLILSTLLFCIGIYGVLTRRNIIGILMSIEIILNAGIINFLAFSYYKVGGSDAAIFSLFIIAIAACEMAVALGITLNLYRNRKQLDVKELNLLNG